MTEKVKIQDVSVEELYRDLRVAGLSHLSKKYHNWNYSKAQLIVLRELTKQVRLDLELMGYKSILMTSKSDHQVYLVTSIELNSGGKIVFARGWDDIKVSKFDTLFTQHIIKNLNAMIKGHAVKSNVYIPDKNTPSRFEMHNYDYLDLIVNVKDDPDICEIF